VKKREGVIIIRASDTGVGMSAEKPCVRNTPDREIGNNLKEKRRQEVKNPATVF